MSAAGSSKFSRELLERGLSARLISLSGIIRAFAKAIVAVGFTLLFQSESFAQEPRENSNEYAVKAGFILNFLRLTTFPSNPSGPLVLCVCGPDQLAADFAPLSGISIEQRDLKIEHRCEVKKPSCSAVFISRDREALVGSILNDVQSSSILSIGETSSFSKGGGIITFFEEEGKIRFSVNQSAALSASLRFSAQLLKHSRSLSKLEE